MELMNRKGQMLDFDFSEPATVFAIILAALGAMGAFWYVGYLGSTSDAINSGFVTRMIAAVSTAIVGYFLAFWIMTK